MKNSSTKKSEIRGVELHIQGIVQGVGFRPFIYNLATRLKISGTVSNTSAGVVIQAAASQARLDSFIRAIRSDAPPLSQILSIDTLPLNPRLLQDSSTFSILKSDNSSTANTAIPADISLCDDCLGEMLSPLDRRHGYPFINCTNCGPRFTIVETIPYDRVKTSMKVFPMCDECLKEYEDPGNRRFHAQPNACPQCGPQISLHDASGSQIEDTLPVAGAVAALNDDRILALRGLGGFHLAVNGCSEAGVARLRRRKNRPSKPLAIMVKDIESAQVFCHLSEKEKDALTSPQHPIVLLRKKQGDILAPNLCPGVGDIGIMLPYTPLHHLLFNTPSCPSALVMTSGNLSGRPICISNESALDQLNGIADFFLLHNREILTRVDDSVTKKFHGSIRLIRRARGYCPIPIPLAQKIPQTLGCGGGLKSTFCLGRGNLAFLSQHIGDLFNLESYEFYLESLKHLKQVFEIEPEIVVRDLHPDYLSSHLADELKIPLHKAQHHHAHAVAVMAEHNLSGEVLAIVLDGTGYGSDGTIWGGEILLSQLTGFQRLGHLQYLPLPGGDKAAAEPWRMAISALYQTYGSEVFAERHLPPLLRTVDEAKREMLVDMVKNDFNSPLTSSCGRLFDAIAALVNLRLQCDYEGHAAMELETLASISLKPGWQNELDTLLSIEDSPFFSLDKGKGKINSSEFVKMVMDKTAKGFNVSQIALDFHLELICAISKLTTKLSVQHETDRVVLSGGCMQNRLLMEGLFYTLEKAGLRVYTGEKVPVNDGGISFGQVIIGGLQHVSCNTDAGYQNIG